MRVLFQSYLSQVTNATSIEIKFKGSLHELLSVLISKYGSELETLVLSDSQLSNIAVILVNDCYINKEDGLDIQLEDTDTITILPIVAGG